MPLKAGSSKKVISQNISEFHGGKTYNATKAKFGKEKADKQAIAVAMSNARKYAKSGGRLDPLPDIPSPPIVPKEWPPHPLGLGKAGGGFVPPKTPWFERMAARTMMNTKPKAVMLHSGTPGRTDKLPLKVPSGSYVLPADVVAGMGQGNSIAGAKNIIGNITSGKFKAPKPPGTKLKKIPYKMGSSSFASGGATKEVPIMAAGGEVVIHPEGVADIGHGDIDHGHNFLDNWVVEQRKKQIRQLKKLKPPVKD